MARIKKLTSLLLALWMTVTAMQLPALADDTVPEETAEAEISVEEALPAEEPDGNADTEAVSEIAEPNAITFTPVEDLVWKAEHAEYIHKAIAWHAENSEKVKSTLEAGKNAVFFFDGVNKNLEGVEITESGYIGSDGRYNRSAVCVVVNQNDSGEPEIIYACSAVTMADSVRGINDGTKGRATVVDGIYDLVTENHNGNYAAHDVQNLDVLRCYPAKDSPIDPYVSAVTSYNKTGIHVHAALNNQALGKSKNADSTGCLLVGGPACADPHKKTYSNFMNIMGFSGTAVSYTSKYVYEKYPSDQLNQNNGVIIVDRYNYRYAIPTIFGNDDPTLEGALTGEQIADLITENSVKWYDAMNATAEYTLSGVIHNATKESADYGKEVDGVTVTRKAADGTVIDSTTTDANGTFSFTFTGEKGDYIFMFSKTGFQTKETAVITIYQSSPSLGAFVIYEEEGEVIASGTCGDNLTWVLNADGVFTVTGTGSMSDDYLNSSGKDSPWYQYREQIKTIVLSDGVTATGYYVFAGCVNLTKVVFPQISLKKLAGGTFVHCSSLEEIVIPDSVTSISWDVLYDCTSLKNVTLPCGLTKIQSSMFYNCQSLTSIQIPATITDILWDAFRKCSTLTKVYFYGNAPTVDSKAFDETPSDLVLYYVEGKSGWTSPTWNGYNTAIFSTGTVDPTEPDVYTLSGVIRNATEGSVNYGKEVEGVTVTRKAADGTVIDSTTSNAEGNFSFTFTGEKGDYIFVLSKAGFQTFTTAAMTIHQNSPSLGSYVIYEEEAEIIASGTCGDNLTWTFDSTGTLTISGEGEMEDYSDTETGYPWNEYINPSWTTKRIPGIEKLVVNEGVISLADELFIQKTGKYSYRVGNVLESVQLPESLKTIRGSFIECRKLASITIPKSVSNISNRAFERCSNLENIFVDKENLEYCDKNGILCSISYWGDITRIEKCPPKNSTQTLEIPSSVTYIVGNAFNNCSNIEHIVFEEADYYSPNITFGFMVFQNCSNLKEMYLPKNLKDLNYNTFEGCSSIKEFTISEENEYYCTDENGILFTKDKSTLLRYPAGSALTTYTVADTVTTIQNGAFADTASLESITLPENMTEIGFEMFLNCSGLKSFTVSSSVTSIDSYAFRGCSSLESFIIPETVTSLGGGVFSGCSSLKEIVIPDHFTELDDSMFYGCASITTIKLPSALTRMGSSIFNGCSSLETINIPDSVSEIGTSAFRGCSNLIEVTFPKALTEIPGQMFCNCTNLTNIEIPETVTSIGFSAFRGCSKLTTVSLPSQLTSLPAYLFMECTSLTDIDIPDTVTSIGSLLFSGCSSLKKITLPKGITTIPSSMFSGCTSLVTIDIPSAVASIGGWAFENCSILSSVYFYGDTPTLGTYAFSNTPSNLTLYYISGKSGWTSPTWKGYNTATFTPGSVDPDPTVPGDITGDGVLDYFDVSAIYAAYQSGEVDADTMDVNNDGVVDYYDVSKLYAAFRGTATLT